MELTMDEEQEQAQNHPPSWASMFDHADPPLFEDAGPSYHPDDRSSAARIGKAVRAREREGRQQRDLAVIAKAAAEQDDDTALERAAELLSRGQPVPTSLRIRAARAANRRGVSIPSHEQLAARRTS
jgi:hypothetical protein